MPSDKPELDMEEARCIFTPALGNSILDISLKPNEACKEDLIIEVTAVPSNDSRIYAKLTF
ncbi:MAG: hypothetical protein MPJ06_04100 [Nitrosopumilus sp.]|nr:hypothetical protein [Nitrosopumilus sp.]